MASNNADNTPDTGTQAQPTPPVVGDITDLTTAPALENMQPSDPVLGAQPMPKPQDRPLRDSNGDLTRDGMLEVIRNGGSVAIWRLIQQPGGATVRAHQIVWRAQDIPDDLELAGDDPEKQRRALDSMERRRAQLDKRIEAGKAKQG